MPKSAVAKYRNISPAKFGVDQGIQPGFTFPLYTLFDPAASSSTTTSQSIADIRSGGLEDRGHQWRADHGRLVHERAELQHVDNRNRITHDHAYVFRFDELVGKPHAGWHPHTHDPPASSPAASTTSTSGTTSASSVPVAGQGVKTLTDALDKVLGQTTVTGLLSNENET